MSYSPQIGVCLEKPTATPQRRPLVKGESFSAPQCAQRVLNQSMNPLNPETESDNAVRQIASLRQRVETLEAIIKQFKGIEVPHYSLHDGDLKMFIALVVCAEFQISIKQMLSTRRPEYIAFPRQVAMFLCRKHSTEAYNQIGKFFDRHHADVMYAERAVRSRISYDVRIKKVVDNLSSAIEDALNKAHPVPAVNAVNAVNNKQ